MNYGGEGMLVVGPDERPGIRSKRSQASLSKDARPWGSVVSEAPSHSPMGGSGLLQGRASECGALDALLSEIRAGRGRSLVLVGEAGIGKSALLEHLLRSASGVTVVRACGVESEMELAYASLQQLLAPLTERLDRLPVPQRNALEVVFGLAEGAPPDRLVVGLGALSLLSLVADEAPLLCVVDDAQWVDRASAWTLAFVARRLLAERVGLVLGARTSAGDLDQVAKLEIGGLEDADARLLLDSASPVRLDGQVRDRIVAETRGNPLALIELPRGLTVTELAGGFGLLAGSGLSGQISASFLRRLRTLPDHAQRLVLLAAAEPLGDPLLLWRAGGLLGIDLEAIDAVEAQGLLTVGERVIFRHPLVRSAAYRDARAEERRAVHAALAEATDRQADPDRRAWHLAASALGGDEAIAAELERSAARAQARGGFAAAAAFLQRATSLTEDAELRAERSLAAAEASMQAGAFDVARRLLATAELGPPQPSRRARVSLVRGRIAFVSNWGGDAAPILLAAARELEPIDVELARYAYLDAWGAALFAGRFNTVAGLREVSGAAKSAPMPDGPPRTPDLLLDALATLVTDGYAAANASTQAVRDKVVEESLSVDESARWGWLTVLPTYTLWDEEGQRADCLRQIETLRRAGALGRLIFPLTALDLLCVRCGDFAGAEEAIAEIEALADLTGASVTPSAMRLAAFCGREEEVRPLIDAVRQAGRTFGQDVMIELSDWLTAVLCNGLGRYEETVREGRGAVEEDWRNPYITTWTAIEVLEAATRLDERATAEAALERVARETEAAGTDSALGILARCRALLSSDDAAEALYAEAIERLERSQLAPDSARAHLLYGEWLRREGRRVDARVQLRAAHEQLTKIGMVAFAERARSELAATGEKVRKRSNETRDDLTPQELRIARLARSGLSNAEISTRLFLSARTVEWHLRKVFAKLGVRNRRGLIDALPNSAAPDLDQAESSAV
jgi:DNA-binding CsgD family transcriptional regulator/tetratricopeptide (TPR) repeat protein